MEDRLRSEFDAARVCAELRCLMGQAVFSVSDFVVAREFDPYEILASGSTMCAMLTLDRL